MARRRPHAVPGEGLPDAGKTALECNARVTRTASEKDAEVTTALPLPHCEHVRHRVRATSPSTVSPQCHARSWTRRWFGAGRHITAGHWPKSLSPALVTRTGRLCVVGRMNFSRYLFLYLDERFAHLLPENRRKPCDSGSLGAIKGDNQQTAPVRDGRGSVGVS